MGVLHLGRWSTWKEKSLGVFHKGADYKVRLFSITLAGDFESIRVLFELQLCV